MDARDFVIEGLHVRFGRNHVLRGIDLTVETGQTTVLLGPNGAGKSTLLRCCLGVVKPREGRVRLLGRDPQKKRNAVLRRVGYVPDKPDAYPWMTVESFFRFVSAHQPDWRESRAWGLVGQLGVPLGRPFSALSKGEGMKAMLAAALASRPEVLLLDEPFAGLDPLIREEVLKSVIGAMGEDEGRPAPTVLVATHDLEVAGRIADRVAVLANGRIRRVGTVDEVGAQHVPSPAAKRLHDALAVAAEEV